MRNLQEGDFGGHIVLVVKMVEDLAVDPLQPPSGGVEAHEGAGVEQCTCILRTFSEIEKENKVLTKWFNLIKVQTLFHFILH